MAKRRQHLQLKHLQQKMEKDEKAPAANRHVVRATETADGTRILWSDGTVQIRGKK